MSYIKLSKNYQHVFHFNGFGFLTNNILVRGYGDLDAMVTSIEDDCYYWLPMESIEKAHDRGVKLFSSVKNFSKYADQFEKILNLIPRDFKRKILRTLVLKRQDVEDFFDKQSDYFCLYLCTEFFFVDKAYVLSKNNKIISKNLCLNYKLKEKGRFVMNNVYFNGKDAYLNILCKKLAKQFKVKVDDLLQYNIQEVSSLFDGKKVNSNEIRKRKLAKIISSNNRIIFSYCGSKIIKNIENLIDKNLNPKRLNDGVLKGTTVSPGKTTGRVKIIISDGTTFKLLSNEFRKMKKGDILVAETTSPELMQACAKAGAILANQGGLLSHAAVVSREFGIPGIVGLKIATQVLKDGDLVEVDADKGIVKILNRYEK